MKKIISLSMVLLLVLIATPSFAVYINWTDWTSAQAGQVNGNMAGNTVTYTGGYHSAQLGSGTNYWTEGNPAPYTGNSVVDNAPTASELIRLVNATSNKIQFSSAVLNPVMAIVSMGQGGLPVTYDFDQDFTVLSEGRGYWGDGSYTLGAGDILNGRELHGVIQFSGLVSEINFTSTYENWHGFTVGAADTVVPEPGTMMLLGSGLLGFLGLRKKFAV